MEEAPKPRQPLLNIGSVLRDTLEELAAADNQRWQDYAREVLKRHVASKVSDTD